MEGKAVHILDFDNQVEDLLENFKNNEVGDFDGDTLNRRLWVAKQKELKKARSRNRNKVAKASRKKNRG